MAAESASSASTSSARTLAGTCTLARRPKLSVNLDTTTTSAVRCMPWRSAAARSAPHAASAVAPVSTQSSTRMTWLPLDGSCASFDTL